MADTGREDASALGGHHHEAVLCYGCAWAENLKMQAAAAAGPQGRPSNLLELTKAVMFCVICTYHVTLLTLHLLVEECCCNAYQVLPNLVVALSTPMPACTLSMPWTWLLPCSASCAVWEER